MALRSRAGGDLSAHKIPERNKIPGLEKYSVVIIGAGPAGIESARELKASGANVVILEAGKRIGGRILNSHESDDPEVRNFAKLPGENSFRKQSVQQHMQGGAHWVHRPKCSSTHKILTMHVFMTPSHLHTSCDMHLF